MRYLLDTHTFIWFIEDDPKLSRFVASEIVNAGNDCLVSIASLWEITIKCSIGKLQLRSGHHTIIDFLEENNIEILPIEYKHLQTLLTLDFLHKDPFDRVIIAQAIAEELTLLSLDKHFAAYPVSCLW